MILGEISKSASFFAGKQHTKDDKSTQQHGPVTVTVGKWRDNDVTILMRRSGGSGRLPWCWCWCRWPGPGPGSVQRTTAFKVQTVQLRHSASDLLARHPLAEEPGKPTRAQKARLPWSNSDPPSFLDTKSIFVRIQHSGQELLHSTLHFNDRLDDWIADFCYLRFTSKPTRRANFLIS